MTGHAGAKSPYAANPEPVVAAGPGPRSHRGVIETYFFETVDDDRVALLLDAGAVR